MTTHHLRAVTAAAALACAAVSLTAQGAGASTPSNGCPTSYELMQVSVLAEQGYQVPGKVDDPGSGIRSFGQLGNDDGWVCALPLGTRTTPWGGQLYNFMDNSLQT